MIQFAQADDMPGVCHIHRQIHRVHTDGRPDIFREPENPAEFDQHLCESASKDNYRLMVYKKAGEIAGFALIRLTMVKDNYMAQDRFSYFIEEFGVDESCRGQGIGTALMRAVIEQAQKNHAVSVDLDVWAFNKNAERFYRKLGMKTKRTFLELPVPE